MKDENIKWLSEIAEKYGFRLVRKERVVEEVQPILAKSKNYAQMDSKRLTTELKLTETEIRKLQAQDEKLSNELRKFMDEQKLLRPPAFYSGDRFIMSKLQIIDNELEANYALKGYLDNLMKKQTERELKEKFIAENPGYEYIVTDMGTAPSGMTGDILKVVVERKEDKAEEPNK